MRKEKQHFLLLKLILFLERKMLLYDLDNVFLVFLWIFHISFCLYDIDDVVSDFLTFANEVIIECAEMVTVFARVDGFDICSATLVTESVDSFLNVSAS